MRSRCAFVIVQVMFVMIVGCGRRESEEPEIEGLKPSQLQTAAQATGGYEIVQVTDGGAIKGTISASGPIPKLPARPLNKDPNVCGAGVRDSQQLIVSKSGAVKNAIIIVEGVKRGKAIPAASPKIDQSKCEYTPHVQVVPVNTEIAVTNSDPILHNIHFYQNDESLFNMAQPVKGQVNTHKLEKPGFVYAECDVHSWMQGHVAVVDNPYYAVTDENGNFSIADLPPGNYKVKVWHEYLGEQSQDISVASKQEVVLNLDLKDLLAKKNPAALTAAPAPGANTASNAPKTAASADAGKEGAPGAEVTVQMFSDGGTFRFEPANITVKVGATVLWVNKSDNRHSATDDPEFEKLPGQAILPGGVEPWSSPFLPEGESFRRKFMAPGKYQYFCRNHGQFGMVGVITVTP